MAIGSCCGPTTAKTPKEAINTATDKYSLIFRDRSSLRFEPATDGHAKNFSIYLRAGGAYALTPFYDVLSAYPVMGKRPNMLSPYKAKLAMAVRSKNPHWVIRDVRRHWLHVGGEYGIVGPDGQAVDAILDNLANRTRDVVNTVKAKLPENFPISVSEPVSKGLIAAADRL